MDNAIAILTIVIPVVSIIVSHILNRRKLNAEVARMEQEAKLAAEKLKTENDIAIEKARTEKEKANAENNRLVSETAFDAIDRLAARMKALEECYDEARARVESERFLRAKEAERLNSEIAVLKEQLEKMTIERKAAEVKLSAAVALAKRYRLIAVDLYQQLLDEDIVPRHVLETCDDIEANL